MPAPPWFDDAFRKLNPFLLTQGWLLVPNILGGELDVLWDRYEKYRTTQPADPAVRREAEREIADVLIRYVSAPGMRAHFVCLAMKLPFVQQFSHLLETGVLHYYRRDFLSSVHCLLPAVEGILRAHFRAHTPGHGERLRFDTLETFLRSERPHHPGTYPALHQLYREALADFLNRWLWKNTGNADWELSHLNRHYVLHGLGNEHYYRSEDCHRLFMFLDLYMEMLVIETRIGEGMQGGPAVARRARHYQGQLVWSEATRSESRQHAFLREHPHYHHEEVREPLVRRVVRWAEMMKLP